MTAPHAPPPAPAALGGRGGADPASPPGDQPRPRPAGGDLPPRALDDLEGASPPRPLPASRPGRQTYRRYEWSRPGALLHVDIARLARFERPGHPVTGDRTRTGAEKRAAGLRLPALRGRRPLPLRLRRAASRPARGDRGRGPAPGNRALRRARRRRPGGGDERQRHRLPQVECLPGRARSGLVPARSSPRPTRRAGTGRSSASSRPSSGSGPTPTPGPTQPTARGPWHPSCATTTGDAPTARWETGRRSAAFTTSVGRTASVGMGQRGERDGLMAQTQRRSRCARS